MSELEGKPKGQHTERTGGLPSDRRRVLEALRTCTQPVSERELARALAAMPTEERSADRIQCRLRHVDLPKLADAGLVTWDRDAATARALDDPDVGEPELRKANARSTQSNPDTSGRGRTIQTLLESQNGSKERAALAFEVAICEHGGEITRQRVADVENTLHHVHLPKLDHAGALQYDPADGIVTPYR